MKRAIQIAFNAKDPHTLADFWAAALGYDIVADEAFVEAMIEQGFATEDDTIRHNGILTWADGAAASDPEGLLPRFYFQRSTTEKVGPNRLHFDLQVGPEHRDDEVKRLIDLGATRLWDGNQGPHSWITLADPEGNEFCVS
ncbi:MAG: VOC family protein [Acidimicrobiales bacterium]